MPFTTIERGYAIGPYILPFIIVILIIIIGLSIWGLTSDSTVAKIFSGISLVVCLIGLGGSIYWYRRTKRGMIGDFAHQFTSRMKSIGRLIGVKGASEDELKGTLKSFVETVNENGDIEDIKEAMINNPDEPINDMLKRLTDNKEKIENAYKSLDSERRHEADELLEFVENDKIDELKLILQ